MSLHGFHINLNLKRAQVKTPKRVYHFDLLFSSTSLTSIKDKTLVLTDVTGFVRTNFEDTLMLLVCFGFFHSYNYFGVMQFGTACTSRSL